MTGYGAPQPQQRSGQQLPLFDLIGAGLGVLAFVWGFLGWYNQKGAPDSQAIKGFFTGGAAAIALSLLASGVVGMGLLEKKSAGSTLPLAASAGALLISFGALIAKPDGYDTKIGLILMLITALAQLGLFVTGWLQAEGKIMSGASASGSGGGQWGGGGSYQQPAQGYQQQPQGYQQPAQPQYGQPAQAPQTPQGYPPQQPPANPYGQG